MTTSTPNHLKAEFPSLAANIPLARVIVAAFATQLDFTLPDLDDIRVAVSEAVTNAVVHAYPGFAPGKVFIEVRTEGEVLHVTVADQGAGMVDVGAARAAAGAQGDSERLGIGFDVIEACMDTLSVESESGRGTVVRMTKRRVAPPAPTPDEAGP
jgi:stage II sporulation protein AB (anti-sigma F factor)